MNEEQEYFNHLASFQRDTNKDERNIKMLIALIILINLSFIVYVKVDSQKYMECLKPIAEESCLYNNQTYDSNDMGRFYCYDENNKAISIEYRFTSTTMGICWNKK